MTVLAPLAVFALVLVALTALGRELMDRAGIEAEFPLSTYLHACAIGTMALCVSVAAMGAASALFPAAIWLWLLAALLLGMRSIRRDAAVLWQAAKRTFAGPHLRVLLVLVGLALVGLSLCAAFREPTTWDEVAYTLFLPKEYVRRNGLPYIEEYGPYSAFPAYQEMLSVAGLLLGYHHLVPHFFNVWTYLTVAWAAALLTRRLGAFEAFPALTFLLVLAMPMAYALAPLTKNDLLVCLFQLLCIDCLLQWRRRPQRALIALAGLYGGFSLGIKYTAMPVAALLGLVLVAFAWERKEARRWWAPVAIFSAAAAFAYLPWALRGVLTTGDPVFPLLGDVIGRGASWRYLPVHSRIMHQMTYGFVDFSLASSSAGIRPLLHRIVYGGGIVPHLNLPLTGAMPYVNLPLVLFVAWRLARKQGAPDDGDAVRGIAAVLFIVLALLPIWIVSLFWEPRYVLVLQVLLVLLVPVSLRYLATGKVVRSALVVAVLAVGVWTPARLLVDSRPWTAVLNPDRTPLANRGDSYIWLADHLNHVLPRNARVATNTQPFYYLERPFVHLHPMSEYGHFQEIATSAELIRRFKDLGVQYVAYDEALVPVAQYTPRSVDVRTYLVTMSSLIRQAEKEGSLRLMETLAGVKLYAVDGARASASP